MRRDAFLSALAAVTALPALPGHSSARDQDEGWRLPPDVRMDPWRFDGLYYFTHLSKTFPNGTISLMGVHLFRHDVHHAIQRGFAGDYLRARLDAAIAMLNEPLP